MLRALSIQNFILIDNLLIDFHKGLTTLTGETGAGKTIILDALSLVIGGRANISFIKNKEKPSIISAEFDISSLHSDFKRDLNEYGVHDETLILKRIINYDGKSRVFINNSISSVGDLKNLSRHLIEICGQHESYGLFDDKDHIKMLDDYANLKLEKLELGKLFHEYQNKKLILIELIELKKRSLEEKSYLEYIISEIEELEYRSDEEKDLEMSKKRLSALEKLKELSNLVQLKLSDDNNGVLASLYILQRAIAKASEPFGDVLTQLNEAVLILEDIVKQNDNLINAEDYQMSLDSIEERLFKIKNLARKYSINPNQIHEFLEDKNNQLKTIENLDDKIIESEVILKHAKSRYIEYASQISEKRIKAANNLQESVVSQLKDIKMDKADFFIEIKSKTEEKWSIDGIDNLKFLIKTNPGMPFGSIESIASGGELSRIMLACKIAMYKSDFVSVMIFDEIDSGISGSVSTSVGKKLCELSKLGQILIVTHQPQVAVFADHHYLVIKKESCNNIEIKVEILNKEERLKEVARMLSGAHVTTEAESAAKSLFEKVQYV